FEDNPYFPTAQTHLNNFDVTPMVAYGIAVHPNLIASDGFRGSVPGICNWCNSADGPSPDASGSNAMGHGALVTRNVRFDPWLTAPAPRGPCQNNNECVADDNDDFDHDGTRDDVDADDDNDGKPDVNDDDDDNDGKL